MTQLSKLDLHLADDGLHLRPPTKADYQAWATERARSRSHTEPWQPAWAEDELSSENYERRLASYLDGLQTGTLYPFMAFRSDDNAFVGMITLSDVRRGVLQAANLGYWIGSDFTRRGYGRTCVRLALKFAFETLVLNRVEAATVVNNTASSQLLRTVGFTEEGLARCYLKINGVWRDHLKFGILHTDPIG